MSIAQLTRQQGTAVVVKTSILQLREIESSRKLLRLVFSPTPDQPGNYDGDVTFGSISCYRSVIMGLNSLYHI